MNYNKITEEEFNKLPQLDRIELRQKLFNFKITFTAIIIITITWFMIGLSIIPTLSLLICLALIASAILTLNIVVWEKIDNKIYSQYFKQTDCKTEVRKR